MNIKQIVTAGLLLLVTLSVGALFWQKSQDPSRNEVEGTGQAVSDMVDAAAQGGPVSQKEAPAGVSTPASVETAPASGTAPVRNVAVPGDPVAPARQDPQAATTPAAPSQSPVQALYLHGTFRCETCNSIEDQAKRAITEDFAAQIQAGGLEFASLNMDKEPHTHYGDDFQLTSASLVLTDGRGPKGRWKVLDRTWELVKDPVAFREYVGTETRVFLAAGKR